MTTQRVILGWWVGFLNLSERNSEDDKVNLTDKPKRGGYRGGSRKGIPNRATQASREAIATFIEGNVERLQEWLDQVASGVRDDDGNWLVAPDPARAFALFQSVIEFHVPKLQRAEMAMSGEVTVKTFNVRRIAAVEGASSGGGPVYPEGMR